MREIKCLSSLTYQSQLQCSYTKCVFKLKFHISLRETSKKPIIRSANIKYTTMLKYQTFHLVALCLWHTFTSSSESEAHWTMQGRPGSGTINIKKDLRLGSSKTTHSGRGRKKEDSSPGLGVAWPLYLSLTVWIFWQVTTQVLEPVA